MKKKAKPRSSRIYSGVQLTGIRHSNTIHRLTTIKRLLQQRIGIGWASYDPGDRNRLVEQDDHDALFLTGTGKAYGQSAYYHHSIGLCAKAQRPFKKEEAVEFTPIPTRRRTVTKSARMRMAMPHLNQPRWSAPDISCNGVARSKQDLHDNDEQTAGHGGRTGRRKGTRSGCSQCVVGVLKVGRSSFSRKITDSNLIFTR